MIFKRVFVVLQNGCSHSLKPGVRVVHIECLMISKRVFVVLQNGCSHSLKPGVRVVNNECFETLNRVFRSLQNMEGSPTTTDGHRRYGRRTQDSRFTIFLTRANMSLPRTTLEGTSAGHW